MLSHPQNLRCRKTGKGNIRCISRQLILANHRIQIIRLLTCSAVIPQNRRTNYRIIRIQHNQTVHLPTKADARHLRPVTLRRQFLQAIHRLGKPILRMLLRPSRLRKKQRILSGHNFFNIAGFIHKQQLHC